MKTTDKPYLKHDKNAPKFKLSGDKTVWKPTSILSPVPPALVTCGDMENSNILTIAWTGTINTIPPITYISVRPSRFSYSMIKNSGEFVINLPPTRIVKEVDFCGIYSGAKYDKFKKLNLTKQKASKVLVPLIKECPINIECKVIEVKSYGSHDMFIAEVLAVNVDTSCIDASGKFDIGKCNLLAFAHGEYKELGKTLANFGFSSKKNTKIKK